MRIAHTRSRNPMRLILQLELPAQARMLPKTRRAVDGYMEDLGSDADSRADVVLALDEACGNVIRHAFPGRADGVIRLRAEISDGAVTVQVEDDGVGFDPYSDTMDPAGPHDVSGRGLGMIRHLMTSVELQSPVTEAGGTRVTMEKVLGTG
ncbi:MAG: ATP-binding protein [Acidimicrobiales bacterium]